jgi:hypothetical protein
MKNRQRFFRTSASAAGVAAIAFVTIAGRFHLRAQENSDFPEGYDAVQSSPNSHRVIFENTLVRVLEVTMPPTGKIEPMHHHRWPSFFLDWDTGGASAHIRYHRGDGTVVDQPSRPSPNQPGHWVVHWMKPEPMHAIETIALPQNPDERGEIRVEIKCSL